MKSELKNFFQFCFQKRIVIFLIVLLGIFLPLKHILALDLRGLLKGFAGWLVGRVEGSVASYIATAIISAFANLLTGIAISLLNLFQGLLVWVISGDFLEISMTGPDNPIVTIGWRWVRDLANIILVLGLILIAIGIILGIEEYKAKKTLPTLIIIALLINFTPIICGFIIDLTNSIMLHLLEVREVQTHFTNEVTTGIGELANKSPLEALLMGFIYFIFALIGAIVYLLFFLIFIGRILILWILVIFSPIAFVSRVFPKGRLQAFFPSFLSWDKWWDEFIRWCTIGIFAAFFIFLSNELMYQLATRPIFSTSAMPSGFGRLFVYFSPILFLLIGFFMTLSAAGELKGSAIIGGILGGATAFPGTVKKIPGTVKKIPETLKKLPGIKQARETRWGKTIEEKARRLGEKIPERIGTKRMRIEAEARHRKEREERIERMKKRMEEMGIEKAEEFAYTPEEKAALFKLKTEKGKLKDTDFDKEKLKALRDYISPKDLEEAAKRRPDFAKTLIGKTPEEIIGKMDPEEFRKTVQTEALTDFEVLKAMSYQQIEEIAKKGRKDQIEALKRNYLKNKKEIKATGRSYEFKSKHAPTKKEREENERLLREWREKIDLILTHPAFHMRLEPRP